MFNKIMQPIVALMALCTIAVQVLAFSAVTAPATVAFAEIIQFPGSSAFLADQSVLDNALTLFKASTGAISVHSGLQLEDPTIGLIVVVWDTLAHKQSAAGNAAITSAIAPAIAPGGATTVMDLGMTNNGESIFTAPLSEFAQWTLHTGETFADAIPGAEALVDGLNASNVTFPPATFGQSAENPAFFIVFAGWVSLAAHETAVSTPAFQALINNVLAIADLVIFHGVLSQF